MKFLTVNEVADQLRASKSFVYDLLSRGRIVHYMVEGKKLIEENDLLIYLDGQRVENNSSVPPKRRFKSKHF